MTGRHASRAGGLDRPSRSRANPLGRFGRRPSRPVGALTIRRRSRPAGRPTSRAPGRPGAIRRLFRATPWPITQNGLHPGVGAVVEEVASSDEPAGPSPVHLEPDGARGAPVSLPILVRARVRSQPPRRPPGPRAQSGRHHRRLQGAVPGRDRLRPDDPELRHAEGSALQQLPDPGPGVDRRRLPRLRRLRHGVGGHLPHAALRGQGDHPRDLVRLLPRTHHRRDGRRRACQAAAPAPCSST